MSTMCQEPFHNSPTRGRESGVGVVRSVLPNRSNNGLSAEETTVRKNPVRVLLMQIPQVSGSQMVQAASGPAGDVGGAVVVVGLGRQSRPLHGPSGGVAGRPGGGGGGVGDVVLGGGGQTGGGGA